MADHQAAYGRIEAAIVGWADARSDVHGLLVVGSRARIDRLADQFSDLDIVIFADAPDALLDSDEWLRRIGPLKLSFVSGTAEGAWRERRAVFAPTTDVDFSVVPTAVLDLDVATSGPVMDVIRPVIQRGSRIIHDPTAKLAKLQQLDAVPAAGHDRRDEAAYSNLVVDFWYHAMWTVRKVRRGELLVARQCLDDTMKDMLNHVIRWQAQLDQPDAEHWHGYRYFESRYPVDLVNAVHATYGIVSAPQIVADTVRTMDIFGDVASRLASSLGYSYPNDVESYVRDWIEETVPAERAPTELSFSPGINH